MSEVPPPYNRSYSFTDFSTYTPNLQQPGNKIDQELNNVRTSLNATIDRLSEIQRDDGKLDSTSLDFNDIFTGLSTQLSLTYAAINSPVFTGSPEAPTPSTNDNSTKIATTEFVKLQDYATQDQLNSIQSSLSNYLTLSGGTLTGTLSVNDGEGSYANVQSSVIYVQQTNAGTGQSNAYGYMWNGGIELGDTAGKWTELTPDHIRFGDGTIQTTAATAGAFLPLAGGTLTGDIIFPADASGNDSQIGPWGLGVENTNGQVAYIQPDVFRIYNSVQTTGTSLDGEGITFNDSTKQVTAGLPLTGGIMSGAIRFDSVGTQNISKGSFDSGRGGYNGISLNCAVGYELNWQAGYLKAINEYGTVQPINIEESSLVIDGSNGASLSVNNYANITTSIAEGIQVISTNQNATQTNIYPATIELRRYISAEEHGGQTDYIKYLNIDSNGIGQSDPNPDAGTNNFNLSDAGVGGITATGSDGWGLNQNGAGGHNDSYPANWGINQNGAGGDNNETKTIWGINSIGVGGTNGDDPAVSWSFGANGLQFIDGSIQVTSALPFTGGTLTGDLIVKNNGNDEFFKIIPGNETVTVGYDQSAVYTQQSNDWIVINGQVGSESTGTIIIGRNYDNGNDTYGIKFYDGSYQTTAGGYLGTSTTSNTVDSSNGKLFYTQKYLLYTPYQKIVIVATDTSNHMHGQVVYYNKTTGQLVFDADTHSGSGTHTNWTINVGG